MNHVCFEVNNDGRKEGGYEVKGIDGGEKYGQP